MNRTHPIIAFGDLGARRGPDSVCDGMRDAPEGGAGGLPGVGALARGGPASSPETIPVVWPGAIRKGLPRSARDALMKPGVASQPVTPTCAARSRMKSRLASGMPNSVIASSSGMRGTVGLAGAAMSTSLRAGHGWPARPRLGWVVVPRPKDHRLVAPDAVDEAMLVSMRRDPASTPWRSCSGLPISSIG